MKAIRFHLIVGEERALPLPEDVHLTPGPVEIIVLQPDGVEAKGEAGPVTKETLSQRLARIAKELNLHGLPADLAANHDYYLHGLPKGIDEL